MKISIETEETEETAFQHVKNLRKRAFLVAFAATGKVGAACAIAGSCISITRTPGWLNDKEFQAAYEIARAMAGDMIEDEAKRRAVDGVRNYKFGRDGSVLRHPDLCVCGHASVGHLEREAPAEWMEVKQGPWEGRHRGACGVGECTCAGYLGTPYYEHSYSDFLMGLMLKGHVPDRYADRMELRGALANLDLARMPDWVIARIAAGEHPMAVLASPPDAQKPGELLLPPGSGGEGAG